jgi:large subunit ribosomal protein L9
MEVILLEDVKSLGKKGDLVKINDGYARNYVLPKKLGIEANAKNLNDLKLKRANDEKVAQQKLEDAKEFAKVLEQSTVLVKIKAGEGGRTFGSISSKEIAQEAKKQLNFDIDKKKIVLDEPIRTLGTHIIQIRLHKDVTAKLNVKVQEA